MFWRQIPRATDVLGRPGDAAPPKPSPLPPSVQRSIPKPSAPPAPAEDSDAGPLSSRPRPRSRLSFSGGNAMRKAVQAVMADEREKKQRDDGGPPAAQQSMADVVVEAIDHERKKVKRGKGLGTILRRRKSVGELLKLKRPQQEEEGEPARITPYEEPARSSVSSSAGETSGSDSEGGGSNQQRRSKGYDHGALAERFVRTGLQPSSPRGDPPNVEARSQARPSRPLAAPHDSSPSSSDSSLPPVYIAPSPSAPRQFTPYAPRRLSPPASPFLPHPPSRPPSRLPSLPPPSLSRTRPSPTERRATMDHRLYEPRGDVASRPLPPARRDTSPAFPRYDPYEQALRRGVCFNFDEDDDERSSDGSSYLSPSSGEEDYDSDAASSLAPEPPSFVSYAPRHLAPTSSQMLGRTPSLLRWQTLPLAPTRPPSQLSFPPSPQSASPLRPSLANRAVGLSNLGNTCYINAVLQCVAATEPLAEFFLSGDYEKEINLQNPLATKGELARAFSHLLRGLLRGDRGFISPNRLRNVLARSSSLFHNAEQQDAHEFLLWLMDALQEEFNLVLAAPPAKANSPEREAELERLPEVVAADQEWAKYRERNDSVVVDFWQGQLRNRMECLRCHQTSTTFEPLHTLSLAIPPIGRQISLADCFDDFLREEIMDGENAWNCPSCKCPQPTSKRFLVARLPQFLIIHLKRFAAFDSFSSKIDVPVHFPLDGLELGGLLPPGAFSPQFRLNLPHERNTAYELYGVCAHYGDDGDGHYKAFVRRKTSWFEVDDERVAEVSEADVRETASTAYLLFYRTRS
ncbi:hypothetical protein JCM10213_005673 [Rhodosporidiobolus nylandii]